MQDGQGGWKLEAGTGWKAQKALETQNLHKRTKETENRMQAMIIKYLASSHILPALNSFIVCCAGPFSGYHPPPYHISP
jgi:hypothetical protein